MPRWRNLAAGEVRRKSSAGDLVTIADHEAEEWLAPRLAALLPGSQVIGEEGVAADPEKLNLFKGDGFLWVIDPIDGTRAFAEGRPTFDVMVALVEGKRPVAGWIYAPAERDLYMGEAGSGGQRILGDAPPEPIARPRVQSRSDLKGIVSPSAFRSRGYADPEGVRGEFAEFSRHTCAGHNYARLLRGDSDFLINFSTPPWDHLAGLAIAGSVGFAHARPDGQPFDPLDRQGGLIVAPDSETWGDILGILFRRA
jgi:fructose-1,6-bisphosphatase/inositol monophosphatase family enzyme